MTKAATLLALRAVVKARDERGLTWEEVATGIGVTSRTLRNCLAWARGDGDHRPDRHTTRAVVKWLARRGVAIGGA
jgi:predicted transcriptional regulator